MFSDPAVSLLAATYLKASLGRNALARVAVLELLSGDDAWPEAPLIRTALQGWGRLLPSVWDDGRRHEAGRHRLFR